MLDTIAVTEDVKRRIEASVSTQLQLLGRIAGLSEEARRFSHAWFTTAVNGTAFTRTGGVAMTGMQTVTPDPVVHAARRMIDDLGPLLNSMEEVVNEREMLRGRCEQIEQDYQALRKTEESTRREGEEAAEALAELRAAYQALLTEYEAGQQTLQHLSEKHGALVQERQDVTNRLEVVLRHLKV